MRRGVTMTLFALATGLVILASSLALSQEWEVATSIAGSNLNEERLLTGINAYGQSAVVACAASLDDMLEHAPSIDTTSLSTILVNSCRQGVESMKFEMTSVVVIGFPSELEVYPAGADSTRVILSVVVNATDRSNDVAIRNITVTSVCPFPLLQTYAVINRTASVLRTEVSSANSTLFLSASMNQSVSLPSGGILTTTVFVKPAIVYYQITAQVKGAYCTRPGSWEVSLKESGYISPVSTQQEHDQTEFSGSLPDGLYHFNGHPTTHHQFQ